MHDTEPRRSKGFTLIELMIVVTILAILAALLLPAVGRAQAKANAMACQAAVRAIGTSIRTYANNWDGWTNPNAEYYPKLYGHKLKSEGAGFNQLEANAVDKFICPSDNAPTQTLEGYYTSYLVTGPFAGQNITNLTTDPTNTIAVRERGRRHPTPKGELEGHYVFVDLHSGLGLPFSPYVAGIKTRVWQGGTWADLLGAKAPETRTPPVDVVWTKAMYVANGTFQAEGLTTWGNDSINLRMDGAIEFPKDGTYTFYYCVDDNIYFWIDINDNGKVDGNETDSRGCCVGCGAAGGSAAFTTTATVKAKNKYKFAFAFLEGGGGDYFGFGWECVAAGVVKDYVPASALFYDLREMDK
jgi:prepilin-type N-terminal cleavage/methylation domain-containing protein